MSKKAKLRKEFYKEFGNYKGDGKYKTKYVEWLEEQVIELRRVDFINSQPLAEDIKFIGVPPQMQIPDEH